MRTWNIAGMMRGERDPVKRLVIPAKDGPVVSMKPQRPAVKAEAKRARTRKRLRRAVSED